MLGLSWHSAETVALILDKTMMRSRLSAAGLDATAHRTVAGAGDVVAFLREQQAPVVLKPTKGTGGVAVAVSTPQEASRAWDELTEQCPPEWGPMVAERQLMGPLLAVDAFSEDGQHAVIGIVRRYNLPGRFVGLDYTCPSGLGEQTEREVADFVVRVLDTLGIVAGPSHTEVILTPEGPQVLETHLRPGGPAVAQVLRDVTGIDLALYMVLHALGMTGLVAHGSLPPLAPPSAKASASCCLVANCEGVVRQIHGREEVLALPGVVEHQLTVEPGQRVGPPRNLDERLGYVRCHGGDPQEALDRCRAAAASIDIWVSALRDPMGPTV
jgi:biotin carboxylase